MEMIDYEKTTKRKNAKDYYLFYTINFPSWNFTYYIW